MVASDPVLLTFFCSLLFALIHLFAGRLRFLEGIPRSRWLSFAGGISVAYVFVLLLPELSEGQEHVEGLLGFAEHHVYLVALLGLVLFYGLERAALESRSERRGTEDEGKGTEEAAPTEVFWLHIASFSFYNALIGYLLLHREEHDLTALLWYVLAMGVHFVVNDFGLREHHKERYHTPGRWILAGAVLLGWLVGVATEISEAALSMLFAFLAGGVVLNVLKEELPEQRKSRFWAFALGCGVYAALLIASG